MGGKNRGVVVGCSCQCRRPNALGPKRFFQCFAKQAVEGNPFAQRLTNNVHFESRYR